MVRVCSDRSGRLCRRLALTSFRLGFFVLLLVLLEYDTTEVELEGFPTKGGEKGKGALESACAEEKLGVGVRVST